MSDDGDVDDRLADDYEWGICWDFRRVTWNSAPWQQERPASTWAASPFLAFPCGRAGWSALAPPPPAGPPPEDALQAPPAQYAAPTPTTSSWARAQPELPDGPYAGDADYGPINSGASWKQHVFSGHEAEGWGGGWAPPDQWVQGGVGNGGKSSGKASSSKSAAWPHAPASSAGGKDGARKGGNGSRDVSGGKAEAGRRWKVKHPAVGPAELAAEASAASAVAGCGEGGAGRKGGAAAAQGPRAEVAHGGGAAGKGPRTDVAAEIDQMLQRAQAPLPVAARDFDWRVRQYLAALRVSGGREKLQEALAMIATYTQHKSREGVKNWPAYLLTLLKRFGEANGEGAAAAGAARAGPTPAGAPAEPAKMVLTTLTGTAGVDEIAPMDEVTLPSGWFTGSAVDV